MNNLFMASFLEVMEYSGYILLAIIVLLIMIMVHEFGHYVVGKIFGFGIEEFSIGFGPKLFSKKKKNGEYFSIRLLPLGGFCAFKGEDEESDDPTAFNNKKPWQRILVLISGALMNYLFALLIICIMFGAYGQTALITAKVDTENNYVEQYSFREMDIILKAEGKNVYLPTDLMNILEGKKQGDIVNFLVRRDGKDLSVGIMLREDASFHSVEDSASLYSVLGTTQKDPVTGETKGELYSVLVKFGFFKTIGRSIEYSFRLAGTIFTVLGQLLTGRIGISSMGGTLTTISVTANAVRSGGLWYLLYIASFIGVNLAVFNLLPIPALDGSRVIFTLIEWIRGKPINRKVEGIIHTVGFILILLFAVFVDLQQCF